MASRQKISQMAPKGANLEATDLLEISELSGSGYITKSITGQEIINAASGGSQNLQQVTDIGATTTNAIQITHSGSADTLTANHTSGSGIGLLITKGGNNEGLKINKTSGSGNAATIIGTLEATTLVKTGGTATEFLMADGTTSLADIIFTIELVDALTVDFYAPYNLKINTVTNVFNAPTTTILDDGVAYTLTNTIAVGSKVTVTVDTASVVNLNIVKA
jgi:hypothetical protein